MNLFFLHHSIKDLNDKAGEHTLVLLQEPEHNITDGSEFLDDAIRMKEQPFMYTEECAVARNSEDL
jgi:hypothetical protein